MKKTISILALALLALSPIMPHAQADSFGSTMTDAAWDYGTYQVQRLAVSEKTQGPFEKNGAVYFSTSTDTATVDLSFVKNGNIQTVSHVSNRVNKADALVGESEFVFDVPSTEKGVWTNIYSYDPQTQSVVKKATVTRASNELDFLSFKTEGVSVFSNLLASDKKTGEVKAILLAQNEKGENRDFTFFMNNPMQQVKDVNEHIALVKMEFPGGNKQLWLMNETSQKVEAIPNTWTEPASDLIYPHFLSNGTVVYFQNFRLFTYRPNIEKEPQAHSDATYNWYATPETSIQINGDVMAFVNADHILFGQSPDGVFKIGQIKNDTFRLVGNTVYFETKDGYRGFDLINRLWVKPAFLVTSAVSDVQIGTKSDGHIWYKNQTSGTEIDIGRGTNPVLSDRMHAYWRGEDGHNYQATFSSVLDLSKSSYQAVKSVSSPVVYLVKDNKVWNVTDEKTYFTWFDSWKSTQVISDESMKSLLASHTYLGEANYAPGTRIKSVANPRVYVIGNDGALHWIISETVAKSLYGSVWSQGIVDVSDTYLWRFATGKDVKNAQIILSI